MAQEKRKTENYSNLGGINTKASQYLTGPNEFLDLKNVDFQTPGVLTKRWGSTQYIGMTLGVSVMISGLYEYERLDGFSQIIFGSSGGLWVGATTGQHQGISYGSNISATLSQYIHFGQWNFVPVLGGWIDVHGGLLDFDGVKVMSHGQSGVAGANYYVNPTEIGQEKFDATTFVNNAFICDGKSYIRYDGSSFYPVGKFPLPSMGHTSFVTITGATLGNIGSTNYIESNTKYLFGINFVNTRGFQSPIWPIYGVDATSASLFVTCLSFETDIYFHGGFGINTVNVWGYRGSSIAYTVDANNFSDDMTIYNSFSVTPGGTYLRFIIGSTVGGQSLLYSGTSWSGSSYSYGLTTVTAFDYGVYPSGATVTMMVVAEKPVPRFLEQYQNRIFLAGFSASPSRITWSDLAEPEGTQDEWYFEARTNDGDSISALKSYNSRLYVFKENSFHELSGDSTDTFFLREISDQYGCVSNRATATFNNVLLFLDKKGVCEFNGANVQIVSNKVQPLFDRMNLSSAKDNATMVHDKQRNQVVIGIPVDGSTTNNFTVVYDYIVGAWTSYNGYSPAVYAMIKGRQSTKTLMWGDYNGKIHNVGSSLMSDNGTGFTCVAKTRFLNVDGNSVQKQYRRLYLDTNTASATTPITVKMMQDYGSSIQITRTMYQNRFQNRIDFGLSARSLAVQIEVMSTSETLSLNGFTVEHRLQRVV